MFSNYSQTGYIEFSIIDHIIYYLMDLYDCKDDYRPFDGYRGTPSSFFTRGHFETSEYLIAKRDNAPSRRQEEETSISISNRFEVDQIKKGATMRSLKPKGDLAFQNKHIFGRIKNSNFRQFYVILYDGKPHARRRMPNDRDYVQKKCGFSEYDMNKFKANALRSVYVDLAEVVKVDQRVYSGRTYGPSQKRNFRNHFGLAPIGAKPKNNNVELTILERDELKDKEVDLRTFGEAPAEMECWQKKTN
eukprot:UN04964